MGRPVRPLVQQALFKQAGLNPDNPPTTYAQIFRGSGIVFALVLATLMVPFQALLTPLFLEMHSLGLTDSLVGLALFYTTFNLPFGVFVMRNTFLRIPWELSEAAAVDGASCTRACSASTSGA